MVSNVPESHFTSISKQSCFNAAFGLTSDLISTFYNKWLPFVERSDPVISGLSTVWPCPIIRLVFSPRGLCRDGLLDHGCSKDNMWRRDETVCRRTIHCGMCCTKKCLAYEQTQRAIFCTLKKIRSDIYLKKVWTRFPHKKVCNIQSAKFQVILTYKYIVNYHPFFE